MLDRDQLLRKFIKPEEKLLFSKALNQVFICEEKCFKTFSDFLDPIKAELFSKVISESSDIIVKSFGGAEGCERKLLGFSPYWEELTEEDFPIDQIEIIFSKTGGKGLSHKDFLGSILGLGIDRAKIGDIFIFEKRAVAFVNKSVSDFIIIGLKSVGRVSVEASIVQDEFFIPPLLEYKETAVNVASLRLDAVISAGFLLSRSLSLKLIQGDKAQINWVNISNPSAAVKKGDSITLRGHGRLIITDIEERRKEGFKISLRRLG
jgi:RNA-binding protein YlmH